MKTPEDVCQADGITPNLRLSLKIEDMNGLRSGQARINKLFDTLSGPGAYFGIGSHSFFMLGTWSNLWDRIELRFFLLAQLTC